MSKQALKKNPENYKAMFRKGKALGSQGYYEKATLILEDLVKKNPAGVWTCTFLRTNIIPTNRMLCVDEPVVSAELKRIQALDKEAERKHNQKMKGKLVSCPV
jgi:hypothetical protein